MIVCCYYQVLGFLKEDSEEEIKKKYQKKKEQRKLELLQNRCEEEIVFSEEEAYCVLSHPDLRGIYNDCLEQGKEEIFIKYIGSQFSSFLKELQKQKKKGDKIIFFSDYFDSFSSFQVKMLRVAKPFFESKQEKDLQNSTEITKFFFSLFEEEIEDFSNSFDYGLESRVLTNSVLPDLMKRFCNQIGLPTVNEAQQIFINHVKIILLVFKLKWKKSSIHSQYLYSSEINKFFAKLRVFEEVIFCDDNVDFEEMLAKFYNEILLTDLKGNETVSSKVTLFLRITCFVLSNKDWKDWFLFQQERWVETSSLCFEKWETSYAIVALFFGENLRFDYYKLLGVEYPIGRFRTLENDDKIKKKCQNAKCAIEKWVSEADKEEVMWQNHFFSRQDAIDWVKEAYYIFVFPEVREIYKVINIEWWNSPFEEEEGEKERQNFIAALCFFRKIIEKEEESSNQFFISLEEKETQGIFIKKILEVMRELDVFSKGNVLVNDNSKYIDFSSLDLISLKSFFIKTFKKKIEKEISFLKEELDSSFDNEKKENKESLYLLKNFFKEDLIKSLILHVKTIFYFKVLKWESEEKNVSGVEVFLGMYTLKKEILSNPSDYLYKFGKSIKESAEKKGWTVKKEINFFTKISDSLGECFLREKLDSFYEELYRQFLAKETNDFYYNDWGFYFSIVYQTFEIIFPDEFKNLVDFFKASCWNEQETKEKDCLDSKNCHEQQSVLQDVDLNSRTKNLNLFYFSLGRFLAAICGFFTVFFFMLGVKKISDKIYKRKKAPFFFYFNY